MNYSPCFGSLLCPVLFVRGLMRVMLSNGVQVSSLIQHFSCALCPQKTRCASFQVRQSAVREGCIVVTLDVLQLANILSSMEMQQQQQQEQAEGEGSKPDQSRRITAANEERFRCVGEGC